MHTSETAQRPASRMFVEAKKLIKLALPIYIAQLVLELIHIGDIVVAGRYSSTDLAGVAIGSSIYLPVMLLFGGIALAAQPIIANLYGAGQMKKIGSSVLHFSAYAIVLSIFAIVALWVAMKPIIAMLGVPDDVGDIAVTYLRILFLGAPGLFLTFVFRGLHEGMGQTRPGMYASLIGAVVNVPLNIILVFGYFGLPALGGVGCAIASVIVTWLVFFALLVIAIRSRRVQATRLFKELPKYDHEQIVSATIFGLPIGLAIFVELTMFSGATLIIAPLGEVVISAHQIVLGVASTTFMLPFALASATTIRVGHAVGARDAAKIKLSIITAYSVALLVGILNTGLILLLGPVFTQVATSDAAVIPVALSLMFIAAVFQIPDGIQCAGVGVLRGNGDTRTAMAVYIGVYWLLCLPLGYAFVFGSPWTPAFGAQGIWWAMVIGLVLAATILTVVPLRRVLYAQATMSVKQA